MEGRRKKIPEKSVRGKSKHCRQWEWERKSREKRREKQRKDLKSREKSLKY